MLPFRSILEMVRQGFAGSPDDLRKEYTAALAVHDLAAKLLQVGHLPGFDALAPHLRILAEGAIHLTEPLPSNSDGYNKLIEVYWASLCLAAGLTVELDHPMASDGRNPDIITSATGRVDRHGYAFKTIRSQYPRSILDHLRKGVDQIERSSSTAGIVALHLTPRLQSAAIWPEGGCFLHTGEVQGSIPCASTSLKGFLSPSRFFPQWRPTLFYAACARSHYYDFGELCLGNGEVDSSILSGSTRTLNEIKHFWQIIPKRPFRFLLGGASGGAPGSSSFPDVAPK
jgi:hypothetical protein